MSGQVKGLTLLPLPVGTEQLTADEDEVEFSTESQKHAVVHHIETALIDWVHDVQRVLDLDSGDLLEKDEAITPLAEIDFWKARYNNLLNIFQQLTDLRMVKMRKLLDASKSSYAVSFHELFDNVAAALQEAEDIKTNLTAAAQTFEDFDQKDFENVAEGFRAILHVIHLIWKRTSYYNSHRRLVVLLAETMNQLITLVSCTCDC